MTLPKSFDFTLPFGPPPSPPDRNYKEKPLNTRCYIKVNISWRPALLTSLKHTKFRRSVRITLLRLNSLISGPDDNQKQTDGRLMNVIGRKTSLNIGFVWKVCFFLQVILMIIVECWHLFSDYSFVGPHIGMLGKIKALQSQWKSSKQNYAVKMEIKALIESISLLCQTMYFKETETSSIPCF